MQQKTSESIYLLFYVEEKQEIPLYVGRSNNPQRRYTEHLDDNSTKKGKVIQYLLQKGYKIHWRILESNAARFKEDLWITNYEGEGYELLNSKSGDSTSLKEEILLKKITKQDWDRAVWHKQFGYNTRQITKINGISIWRTKGMHSTCYFYSFSEESYLPLFQYNGDVPSILNHINDYYNL